jgi:hypothetical protein
VIILSIGTRRFERSFVKTPFTLHPVGMSHITIDAFSALSPHRAIQWETSSRPLLSGDYRWPMDKVTIQGHNLRYCDLQSGREAGIVPPSNLECRWSPGGALAHSVCAIQQQSG